jgi:hypothetical protein
MAELLLSCADMHAFICDSVALLLPLLVSLLGVWLLDEDDEDDDGAVLPG